MPIFKKQTRKTIDLVASWLLIIGGINWGLTVLDFNLVTWLAEATFVMLSTIVYSIVGLSALWVGSRAITGKLMK